MHSMTETMENVFFGYTMPRNDRNLNFCQLFVNKKYKIICVAMKREINGLEHS